MRQKTIWLSRNEWRMKRRQDDIDVARAMMKHFYIALAFVVMLVLLGKAADVIRPDPFARVFLESTRR